MPTTATLSGSSTATTDAAHTDAVTLDHPADVVYTVTWSRSDGGTGPATSTIGIGQTATSGATSTWAAAGAGRTVDFTISPSLTRAGRPLSVTVSDALVSEFAYRSENTTLFSDFQAAGSGVVESGGYMVYPARSAHATPKDDYLVGIFGPTKDYVEARAKWPWTNSGGDWVNTAGTAQGTTLPYFTFTANAVASGSSVYTAADDLADGVNEAFRRGKWNAYIVKSTGGTRSIATPSHATLDPPSLSVTYMDGTTATLACVACTELQASTSFARIGDDEQSLGSSLALEFEFPAAFVSSALLNVTITQHTGTSTTVNGYLCSPDENKQGPVMGVAADYALDDGLSAEPSIIFAQRFEDGTSLSDWVIPTATIAPNLFASSAWDQGMWGGSDDTSKLPTAFGGVAVAGQHKWIHKIDTTANISLVASDYTGDNFRPFADGLGALRIVVPGSPSADGEFPTGYAVGSDLWAPFPKSICGLADDVYTRFAVRFAFQPRTMDDTPFYRESSGGTAQLVIPGGKFGPGVHHWTYYGGNAGYSGNQRSGWTNRLGFQQAPADLPVGGTVPYVHSYDNFADGHDMAIGLDGLGAGLYADRWYEVEVRCALNSYDSGTGTGSADGVMQVWIDGRLAAEHTGWMYRDGAINYTATPNGPNMAPFREMGAIGLLLNNYVGGVRPPGWDVVMFYSCIAAGTSYIGPVRDAAPAWKPAAGEAAIVGYTAGSHPVPGLKATISELSPKDQPWAVTPGSDAPWNPDASSKTIGSVTNWCGGAWDKVRRRFYSLGAGHGAYVIPTCYYADVETLSYQWAETPLPSDGLAQAGPLKADMIANYPSHEFDADEAVWLGDSTTWPTALRQPGVIQPVIGHLQYGLVWIPGTAANNVNGILLNVGPPTDRHGGTDLNQRTYFDLDTNRWNLTANFRDTNAGYYAGAAVWFGGSVNKAFAFLHPSSHQKNDLKVFDPATLTWSTTYATASIEIVYGCGGLIAHEDSGLLITLLPSSSGGDTTVGGAVGVQFRMKAVSASTAAAGAHTWAALAYTNAGGTWPLSNITGTRFTFECLGGCYCPVNGCIYIYDWRYASTTLWKITPPAGAVTTADYLAGTWAITTETFGGDSLLNVDDSGAMRASIYPYNRLIWDDVSGCLLGFPPYHLQPFFAIRPTGL